MVLRDDLHGVMVLHDFDVAVSAARLDESALNLEPRVVGMVEDSELRVSAFTVKVEGAVGLLVEVHAPLHQSAYAIGPTLHHLFHSLRVGDEVAGNHGVFNVLLKGIDLEVRHTRHAALRLRRIGLVDGSLANQCHLAFT